MSALLTVAISSRALFDLSESHTIFKEQGVDAFRHHQQVHEYDILKQGTAFGLVQKLLALNTPGYDQPLVEVMLLSRNAADTGLRIFHSIEHYQLPIKRAAFAGGANPYPYARAFGAHLFLSADAQDVEDALKAEMAAATLWSGQYAQSGTDMLRIAFDGDCVLFSDEAESIFQQDGIDAFNTSEQKARLRPLTPGPLKPFLAALHQLQQIAPGRVRTALVTARSAPAHERVIRTLRAWEIEIDEALFLGGLDKAAFLSAFGADIFFDDNHHHCKLASNIAPTAHVPFIS